MGRSFFLLNETKFLAKKLPVLERKVVSLEQSRWF
jgi:hypothetical protein